MAAVPVVEQGPKSHEEDVNRERPVPLREGGGFEQGGNLRSEGDGQGYQQCDAAEDDAAHMPRADGSFFVFGQYDGVLIFGGAHESQNAAHGNEEAEQTEIVLRIESREEGIDKQTDHLREHVGGE